MGWQSWHKQSLGWFIPWDHEIIITSSKLLCLLTEYTRGHPSSYLPAGALGKIFRTTHVLGALLEGSSLSLPSHTFIWLFQGCTWAGVCAEVSMCLPPECSDSVLQLVHPIPCFWVKLKTATPSLSLFYIKWGVDKRGGMDQLPEAPSSWACFVHRLWRKQQKLVSAIPGTQSQVESSAQTYSVK